MKCIPIMCVVSLALSTVAFAQVTLNPYEPLSGNDYTSPVTVAASASSPNGPSGWDVYLDTVRVAHNTDTTGRLDTTFPASPGTHTVVIRAFDNSGAYSSATENITVNSSALPTPPSDATEYANLQTNSGNPGTWTVCDLPSCNPGGTVGGTGTGGFNFGVNTPSLSGSAMEIYSTGTTAGDYWNTLGYHHFGCPTDGCTSVSNFLEDMWFYVPSSSTALQALEYDPGVYDGSYKSFASMQCDSLTGDWRFWDSAANTWTRKSSSGETITVYPCNILSQKNSWHHYQLYVTMNFTSHTITYETFVVDGVTVFQNLGNTYSALYQTGTPTINIEQQIDNVAATSTPVTDSEYLDNYNYWIW